MNSSSGTPARTRIHSFSSVEYFYGSETGYDGTPDHTLTSLVQGRLFGLSIACVGDLNGDGFDEHIITEPLNATGGFGTGTLWLFEGTDQSLPGEPDWQHSPTTPNTRIGEAVSSAGDVNEDGYDDVYISSRMGSSSGRLELHLGSASGLTSDGQLIAEGNAGERLGFRVAADGDVDGDGLSDLVYSLLFLRTKARRTVFPTSCSANGIGSTFPSRSQVRCPTFNSERPAEARPLWCSRTTTGQAPTSPNWST